MTEAPQSTAPAADGLDPRMVAALTYLAGWLTGVLFLAVERRQPLVRFHAAQSVVVFGGLSAVMAITYAGALGGALLSATAFRVMLAATNVLWLTGVLCWAWLLLKAARGERWRMPGTARLVEWLAAPR